MSFLIRKWNNRTIRFRDTDKYVCLTDMASSCEKYFGHWKQLNQTQDYLQALSDVIGIPISALIEVRQGGNPKAQGTWGHPKVAIRFAQWCSPDFAVQVDTWIDELFNTGKVELNNSAPVPVTTPKPLSTLEMLELSLQVAKEHEQRVLALEAAQQEQASLIQELNKKIDVIAAQPDELALAHQRAREYLTSIDTQGIEPIYYTLRTQLNQLVRSYCVANNLPFRDGWNWLYQSFRDAHHIDLKVRAKNRNKQTLDYVEGQGYLELLMRTALQIFKLGQS